VLVTGQRIVEPELLDNAGPQDVRECLRDLARLNHYFGGYRILRSVLREFVGAGDRFSMLDVGAASGDSGAAIRRSYPGAEVISLDRQFSHLDGAAQPKLAADAFRLPFRPASVDFVFSSLFLHHFSNDQIVALLGCSAGTGSSFTMARSRCRRRLGSRSCSSWRGGPGSRTRE